jgi:hypothetical protein
MKTAATDEYTVAAPIGVRKETQAEACGYSIGFRLCDRTLLGAVASCLSNAHGIHMIISA